MQHINQETLKGRNQAKGQGKGGNKFENDELKAKRINTNTSSKYTYIYPLNHMNMKLN